MGNGRGRMDGGQGRIDVDGDDSLAFRGNSGGTSRRDHSHDDGGVGLRSRCCSAALGGEVAVAHAAGIGRGPVLIHVTDRRSLSIRIENATAARSRHHVLELAKAACAAYDWRIAVVSYQRMRPKSFGTRNPRSVFYSSIGGTDELDVYDAFASLCGQQRPTSRWSAML